MKTYLKEGAGIVDQKIRNLIKKQPLLIVGGVFAVGFIIGRLIRRHS